MNHHVKIVMVSKQESTHTGTGNTNLQRKAKLQEKALAQWKTTLYMNSKAHIASSETYLKQAQETNRILKDMSVPQSTDKTQGPPLNSQQSQEERLASLENKLNDVWFSQLESKVEMLLQQNREKLPIWAQNTC